MTPTQSLNHKKTSLKPMEAAPPIPVVSDNEDDEGKALRSLVDVVGSNFSAEQIVSAFCDAGKRADVAGQILCDMLGTSSSNADASQKNSDHHDVSIKSSFTPNVSQNLSQGNGNNPRSSKVKCPPASVGAVSSFLGKDYTRSKPLASGPQETAKPIKLNAEFLPMSELWPADANMDDTNKHMHKEMEDFLYKMLGVGFQLDRDRIADILGTCGYDMQKSMDRVFECSASILDRKMNQLDEDSARKHRDSSPNSQTFSLQKEMQHESPTTGDIRQARNHLQKELLMSLFTASERDEDLPKPIMRGTRRSNVVYAVVDEPPKNSLKKKTHEANSLEDKNEEVEEDKYTLLRRAVQEHRNTMKEYYTAAIDAFKKGDQDRANKLVERGKFFQAKAHEADEESTQMMFKTNRNEEISSDFVRLDLHEYDDVKNAIRTLKQQIAILTGIPSYKYLKVIIESNNEDSSKGTRRKLVKQVMKVLERDSIKWVEEGTAGTILIPLS